MQDCRAILPLKPAPFADKRGFTLIELSIVLVIIGLIIGGILMGNTLIKSAEIRGQISDIQKLDTAINTFKLKYNCLPGDCAQATQLFGGVAQPELVTNGDGDGKIAILTYASPNNGHPTAGDVNTLWAYTFNSNYTNYAEWTGVFDHLAAAGLWPIKQYDERVNPTTYPDVVCPALRFKPVASGAIQGCMSVGYVPGYVVPGGYSNIADGHKIALGAYGGTGPLAGPAGPTPSDAYAVDSKIDDGMPFTGKAVVMHYYYMYRSNSSCNNGTGYSNSTTSTNACPLYIGANF